MATDKPLEDIFALFGKRTSTTTENVRTVLHILGYHTERYSALNRTVSSLSTAILAVRKRRKKNWHWVLLRNGKIHDPWDGKSYGIRVFKKHYHEYKFTFFIQIKKGPNGQ